MVWYSCSFCWYWCNCSSRLFNLSFIKKIIKMVTNEAHLYSYIVYTLPSLYTIHFYPAIVLSIFMLSFIFVVVCNLFKWKRICEFCYRLFINVMTFKFLLSRGGGWDPINCFNPTTCVCLTQVRTCISNAICHDLFVFSEWRWEVIVRFVHFGEIQ